MAESIDMQSENGGDLRLPAEAFNISENIEQSPQVIKQKITKAGVYLSNSKPRKTTSFLPQKPVPEAPSPQSPDTIFGVKNRRSDFLTKSEARKDYVDDEGVPRSPNKKSMVTSPARTQPDVVAVFEVNLDSNDSQFDLQESVKEYSSPSRQIEPTDLLNLKKVELLESDQTSQVQEEEQHSLLKETYKDQENLQSQEDQFIKIEEFKVENWNENIGTEQSNGFEIGSQEKREEENYDTIRENEIIQVENKEKLELEEDKMVSNLIIKKEEQTLKPKKERKSRQQRAQTSKTSQESQSPPKSKSDKNQFLKDNLENLFDFEKKELDQLDLIYFSGLILQRQKTEIEIFKDKEEEVMKDFDDEEGYYNIVLGDHISYRYEIIKILGKGSFAQVVMARDHKEHKNVALKVTRNTEIDHKFAKSEQKLLKYLMEQDQNNEHNLIRLFDTFEFRSHVCFSFELLDSDLFEYLKEKDFMGLSTNEIKQVAKQLLKTLSFLEQRNIIHCDLKPENIMVVDRESMKIKLVDYGSGCFVDEQVYTYVQSRFYRAPEVILRLPYTEKVDMWSFGCILAELYTGDPLFPGNNEQEQIEYIMEICDIFPTSLLEQSRKKEYYFDEDFSPFLIEDAQDGILRIPGSKTFEDAIRCSDKQFIELIEACLQVDPHKRLTASQALKHPWFEQINMELKHSGTIPTGQPRQREEVVNAQEEQSPIKVIKDKIKKTYTKMPESKTVTHFENEDVLSDSPPQLKHNYFSEFEKVETVKIGGYQESTLHKPLDKIRHSQQSQNKIEGDSLPSQEK